MTAPRRVPIPPAWSKQLFTVGITGTNGKTTTTAWVAAALRRLSKATGAGPVARATTVGFFLDDERVLLEKSYTGFVDGMATCFERGGRFAAVELTSEALAKGFAKAWQSNVGVFTNLTHDHLDAHGSPEHYLASKAQLFVSLQPGGTAVLNAGDPVFELLSEIIPAGVKVLSYAVPSRGAVQGTPDLVATSVDVSWAGTTVTCAPRDPASGLPSEVRVRATGGSSAVAQPVMISASAMPHSASKKMCDISKTMLRSVRMSVRA